MILGHLPHSARPSSHENQECFLASPYPLEEVVHIAARFEEAEEDVETVDHRPLDRDD